MTTAPTFTIPRRRVVSRIPEILRLCAGRKVLHLGCADVPYTRQRGDGLLHRQLAAVIDPDDLWGLDSSEEGVRLLQEMGFDHIILGDVESMESTCDDLEFEIILAGELIEHVNNPGLFLSHVASLMSDRTELVITTPNAFSAKQFVRSLFRREKVHEDHNFYYSYRTLTQLLGKFGLECRHLDFYQERDDRPLFRVLEAIFAIGVRISPPLADGLVVRAVRKPARTDRPQP